VKDKEEMKWLQLQSNELKDKAPASGSVQIVALLSTIAGLKPELKINEAAARKLSKNMR
jgi:hypothetical protein